MKNLILLFAIISLFSCKKETISITESELTECLSTYVNYKALIVQFEENNPAIDLIKNDIGHITFSRSSKGIYYISSNNLFIEGKTTITINEDIYTVLKTTIISSNTIKIETRDKNGSLQDSMLVNAEIEIRVYD